MEEPRDTRYSSSGGDSNDRDYEDGASHSGFTFNTVLVSLHTYLGEVEDTHHRLAFFDGDAIINLPMFYLKGIVLFPGATLPLRVVQPSFIAAVEKALNQLDVPYTIGVVHMKDEDLDDERLSFGTIGTTAEIRKYRRLGDGSLNVVTRGQQRFHLRRHWIDAEGVPLAEIKIIQEDVPLRTPRDAFGQLASVSNSRGYSPFHMPSDASHIKRHRDRDGCNDLESAADTSLENGLSPTEMKMHLSAIGLFHGRDRNAGSRSSYDDKLVSESESEWERSHLDHSRSQPFHEDMSKSEILALGTRNKYVQGIESHKMERRSKDLAYSKSNWSSMTPTAFWPYWVYQMYDSYCLARRAADLWSKITRITGMDELVKKPDLLSFFIASKIPVSESTRQELLEINGISRRLRREIQLLESFDRVHCKYCQTIIARRSDILVMSSDGPLGAYVNQNGYVHEIMTLYKANGLALIGHPVKEYSWFPGYAWTIAKCATCRIQMGWMFTATDEKLKPSSFWGIRSSEVADGMH